MKNSILTILFFLSSIIYAYSQCPTKAIDNSSGVGTLYSFTLADCSGYAATFTTDGGGTFSNSNCIVPTLSTVLLAGVPDALPFTIDFGGTVGSCEYDAAGDLVTLPVELVSFVVKSNNSYAELLWETATEENNQGFEIEYSTDGESWQNIGFVEGNSTTTETQNYTFTHETPTYGINYYRLKQIDFNGVFDYSDIKTLEFKEDNQPLVLSPNPVYNQLVIKNAIGNVIIYNTVGQPVREFEVKDNIWTVDLSNLESGSYFFQITKNTGEVITKALIK